MAVWNITSSFYTIRRVQFNLITDSSRQQRNSKSETRDGFSYLTADPTSN